ncbi:MAG: O-methyltransferase [Muribaculaceae bacterium]|nr:O-methyltransferase [Muribaculaceae bacterium]
MNPELEEYILNHIEPEPDHLSRLNRRTQLYHLYSRQCSGHLQGRLLSMLSNMVRPRRILELGTFTGYSALCLAEGLAEGGMLHTVEHNDEDEEDLKALFELHDPRIVLHIGDASEMIKQIDEEWDFVFIDANKREYVRYLELLLPKLKPGAFILADNTLWGGKLTDETEHDAQTEGIRSFNDFVASMSARLHPVILPLRDGMTLMRVSE